MKRLLLVAVLALVLGGCAIFVPSEIKQSEAIDCEVITAFNADVDAGTATFGQAKELLEKLEQSAKFRKAFYEGRNPE